MKNKNVITTKRDLIASALKWQAIFDGSKDSILLLDFDGIILQANNTATKTFNKTKAELIGQKCCEIVKCFFDTTGECLLTRMKAGMKRETMVSGVSGKYFEIVADPICDDKGILQGAVYFITDITERKASEEIIKSDQILLKACIDSPQDVIVMAIDKQFNYLTFNSYFKELIRKENGIEIRPGMNLFASITNKEDVDKLNTGFSIAMSGKSHITVEEYGYNRGLFYETRFNPIFDRNNEVIGATAFSADITERIRMEKDLKKSEEKFRKAFITSIDAVNINRLSDGMYVLANDGFLKLMGYSEESIIGKTSLEINTWVDPCDRQRLVEGLKEKGKVENLEARFRCKDGSVKYGIMSASLIDIDGVPHLLNITRDITERKKTENALKKSEMRFRDLIEVAPDGILLISRDQSIILVNTGLLNITCKKQEELLGKKLDTLFTPDELTKVPLRFDLANKGETVISQRTVKRSDQKLLIVEMHTKMMPDGTYYSIWHDITKRRQDELLLEESNRTINTLISNLQGIVYKCRNDKNWTMEYLSKGTKELTGYLPEELLHNDVISFYDIIYKEDRDFVQSEVQIALKNKEHFQCTYRIVTRSGEVKWVWDKGEGIFDENGRPEHREGFITDITQRKILEEEKIHGEQRYRELFLNNPVPTYIFDENTLEFIEVNDATVHNYEYSKEEFASMTLKDIRVPEDIPELNESIESMKKLGSAIYKTSHFRHKKKSGVAFPVEITSHLLPVKNGRRTRLVMAVDITDRLNAAEQMRLSKEKAEASDRLKTMFLNNISHEVRTPLNGILGFAGIISQEILSVEERAESLRMLQDSSDRLLATITNYMDISLITSGNMSVYKRNFSPKEIVSSLFNNYKTLCTVKGLELLLELPGDSENLIVNNDPEILKKIFSHLLNNAIKFTDHGTVRYGYCFRNGELEFFVKDSGIGIKKESLAIVFDNFVKEDPSPSKLTEGSGLGLSISKGLTDILGGSIRVESEPGSGSSFYFSIPLEIKSEVPDKGFPAMEHGTSKGAVTVLVAEDDETNFLYLKAVLAREVKASVLHASNGREAIELFKSNPEVKLILMDIKMPEIDGLEATRQIKLLNNNIPIIAITAYAMSGDEDRVLAAGCDCYMSKPISKKDLLDKIAEYVKF